MIAATAIRMAFLYFMKKASRLLMFSVASRTCSVLFAIFIFCFLLFFPSCSKCALLNGHYTLGCKNT